MQQKPIFQLFQKKSFGLIKAMNEILNMDRIAFSMFQGQHLKSIKMDTLIIGQNFPIFSVAHNMLHWPSEIKIWLKKKDQKLSHYCWNIL